MMGGDAQLSGRLLEQIGVWLITGIMAWTGWNTHQTAVSVAVMAKQLEEQTKRLDQHDDRFENFSSRIRAAEAMKHRHDGR